MSDKKPGFLDIAPRTKTVTIDGVAVTVAAISLGDIAALALRFKPFRDLLGGTGMDMAELVKLGGPIVAGLIAAGLGKLGDEAHEAKAASLSAGQQGELLLALYETSFPESVRGPFADRLRLLFNTSLGQVESTLAAPSASATASGKEPAV